MIRNLVCFLSLLSIPCWAYPANPADKQARIDSLNKVLPQLAGAAKASVMLELADYYLFTTTNRALELFCQAEVILKSTGDSTKLKSCYKGLAVSYDLLGLYDSAELQYNKGFAIAGSDSAYLAKLYGNFGIFNAERRRFADALTYLLKALTLNERSNNRRGMLKNYGNIGYVHNSLGNYEKAAQFDSLAYQMAIEIGEMELAFMLLANLGVALRDLGNLEAAKHCIKRAVRYYESTSTRSVRLANQYLALGKVYDLKGTLDSAYLYAMKSLELLKFLGPTKYQADVYDQLSENLLMRGKIYKAEWYAKQAIEEYERLQDLMGQKRASFTLMKIYLYQGDIRSADLLEQQYLMLAEKIDRQEQEKAVIDQEIRYETAKKLRENEMLRKETRLKVLDLQKKNYIILTGMLGLLAMLATVFVTFNKCRERIRLNTSLHRENEALKVEHLTVQLDRLKEQVNPHFLFNSLASLKAMAVNNDPKAGQFLEDLSNVYRYILQTNVSALVPLRKEIEITKSYLFTLNARFGENLQVSIEISASLQEKKIPSFSLQRLIEIAIENNLTPPWRPLKIAFFASDSRLYMRYTLQSKSPALESTNPGLANLAEQYRLLGQDDVEIEKNGKFLLVSLPLLA